MAFDGLANFSLNAVQLHEPNDAVLLSRDADQKKPILLVIRPVIDYLTTVEAWVTVEHLLRS